MKKIGLIIATVLILFACSEEKTVQIEVLNESTTDRVDEIVSIPWSDISAKLALTEKDSIIVLDEENGQMPYQIIYDGEKTPQSVIFQATAAAGEKIIYKIKKGKPDQFERKTYGRAVPERKDDFAWENDRIAFRMYGPALAPENPSNGVDIWLKRTTELVLDKFYSDELKNNLSYHVDHGLGLDCYKVAHTLGAGGIAPYVNDSLWVGTNYNTAELVESGILRTTFILTYDSIPVNDKFYSEKIKISLDAASQLSKAVVTYDGDFDTMQVAAGMWLHKEIGIIETNKEKGYIAYAENAVSDAGVPSGRDYIGVFIPSGMTDARQQTDHLLGFANYKKGDQFTYYFGAGWSKWGYDTDEAWFKYMNNFAEKISKPLKVTILTK